MSDKRSGKKLPRSKANTTHARRPSTVAATSTARTPAALPAPSIDGLRPSWRFGGADPDGAWCLGECDAPTLHAIIAKLTNFESMTVAEMRGEILKGYAVDQMPPRAQRRLVDLGRDDETELHRLRLTGANRLYGILDDAAVFHILWWDPNHEVYPSKKKHT